MAYMFKKIINTAQFWSQTVQFDAIKKMSSTDYVFYLYKKS